MHTEKHINAVLIIIIICVILLYFSLVWKNNYEHFNIDDLKNSEYIIIYNGDDNFYVYRNKLLLFVNNDFSYITQYFRNLNVKFPPLINKTTMPCLNKDNYLILQDEFEYKCSRSVANKQYEQDKNDFYNNPKKSAAEYKDETDNNLLSCMMKLV